MATMSVAHVSTKPHYTLGPGYPSPMLANLKVLTAVRIARLYRDRIPTVRQLQNDLGMHRATAYRWRAALIECVAKEAVK